MTNAIQFYPGVSAFCDQFDAYIVDLWGVLHDGQRAYPGAIDCLRRMRQAGKKICLLSNAPRRAFKVVTILENLGFDASLYDALVTSGEVTWYYLDINKDYGDLYYYIGPEKDRDVLAGTRYRETENPFEAAFVLVTGYEDFDSPEDEKDAQIKKARAANLPMICANPDMTVVRQSGERMHCAGLIAEKYQKMGGKVRHFGKPYNDAYEMCLEALGVFDTTWIAAIGDALHTDVAGANSMGMYAVLAAGGIHRATLTFTPETLPFPTDTSLSQACEAEGSWPQALIPMFVW